MVTGLVLDGSGFELLIGDERIGTRRALTGDDERLLTALSIRYGRATQTKAPDEVLLGIGRDLWSWLDGDAGSLTDLLSRAPAPVLFEVRGPRTPSDREWAVLHSPFELLARPDGGFLAADALSRFGVVRRLGRPDSTVPEPDGFRLGLAFMASSPRSQFELDYEAEEAAILAAVDPVRIDLLVEDTGDPRQLGRRLADVGGMPVVHLSCHAAASYAPRPGDAGVPVLMMEDEVGDNLPTTAGDLVRHLVPPPRLLFVSGCMTTASDQGTEGSPAHSMATALVTSGLPAVLGWDGPVYDRAATVFAKELYRRLSDRADLALAVGDARRTLLSDPAPAVRVDWHLARLWLGLAGGGPLVSGRRRRTTVSAVRGTKVFLDRKHHVPVAAPEMFVGRRPELQRALRALRSGEHSGVLLHGLGRLGKSSLAARIADRCPEMALAVVFGDYSALAILDNIGEAVRSNTAARELLEERRAVVRDQPDAIGAVLTDLLAGPCSQPDGDRRPLLLIIDDLEQVLEPRPSGLHRVDARAAPVLTALLRAFDPGETDSRLLVTSRFQFVLDGLEQRLEPVMVRPLSPVAQRKLLHRQTQVAPGEVADRAVLAERAMNVSRGNPGLQDLLGLRLVYAPTVGASRAEAAVNDMESFLQQGDLPTDTDLRAFLENLALDALLEQAGPDHRDLLRDLTLFDLPAPAPVVSVLAQRTNGSLARLGGLGLIDVHPDSHDGRRSAFTANALVSGRLAPLRTDEIDTLAGAVVEPLFSAWGGASEDSRRLPTLDLQLTRLALRADDPRITAVCAAGAVQALRAGPAVAAFHIGEESIALIDRHRHPVPILLLRRVADAAHTGGFGEAAHELFARAVESAQTAEPGQAGVLDRARVIAEYARHLSSRGDSPRAEELLRQAHRLFSEAGSRQEAAACQGAIAEILYQRGDYDEALRIHHEEQLPVYRQLADARSEAITWSRIADIMDQRGDYDEALRIRFDVELPVYQRLGDERSAAVAWGKIADIHFQRGEYDEALRIRLEIERPVHERLGDARQTAMTLGKIADILHQRGDYDEALRIRREAQLPVFERLGDIRETAVAWGRIADILEQRGDYDEALHIHQTQLAVYERLGDTRSNAFTWGKIADILHQFGDYDEALRLRQSQLAVYQRLGDPRSCAVTSGRIADILEQRGDHDEALRIHQDQLAVYERLGDIRSLAVTWGRLADILVRQQRLDEAADLQGRRLAANERLGDPDGIAAAHWGLAQVNLARADYEAALRHLTASFQLLRQLGRPDGIAVVGGALAQLLFAAGATEQAQSVRDESVAAAEKIGATELTQRLRGLAVAAD
ncbi:tetratricopeptide repeat protein [Actinoplanes hulinensis]|uniref:Tetratricopeptide repeat protein n=1 Tax=Actinoplanes hulinensis TaxID=1144547 RepID=A0ABS7B8B8_9ACTN|nr:tetratricopeptide repeat protein [Actinoplanes hulinensis]MBW6437195.1 tetratricopeptide repeat protein [Actinoplanes hulinensis]